MDEKIEKLSQLIGKEVKSIKNLSGKTTEAIQIAFSDGTIFIVRSNAYGDEVDYEELDIDVYTP